MWLNSTANDSRGRGLARLYQESLVSLALGRLGGRVDDRADNLRSAPLYLFFYNQRVIFYACAGLFVGALAVLTAALPSTAEMALTVWLLAAGWLGGTLLTLMLHGLLVRRIDSAPDAATAQVLAIFRLYYVADSLILFGMVAAGRSLGLNLGALASLLFAYTLIYASMYFFVRGYPSRADALLIFAVQLTGFYLLRGGWAWGAGTAGWFGASLNLAPPAAASLLTAWLILMVASYRGTEHYMTRTRLELLGYYERLLSASEPAREGAAGPASGDDLEGPFNSRIAEVLRHLCSRGYPFWYRSACIWSLEKHQDRGGVLLPGPCVNYRVAEEHRDGVSAPAGLWKYRALTLVPSLREGDLFDALESLDARPALNAPAAFIPLRREQEKSGEGPENVTTGLLALFGDQKEPLLLHEERTFLLALGSIISSAMEQWEGRFRARLQNEVDDLFKSETIYEVFQRVADIMRAYLGAAGCVIVFRPNPSDDMMYVAAKDGFNDELFRTHLYRVGKGQTGRCAAAGQIIRFDDVPAHAAEFEGELLGDLERAHGAPILSYMAVPIGTKKNYGVIKVVNRISRRTWFTQRDEDICRSIALRLQVIVEKFLYVEKMASALQEADERKTEAVGAARTAELERRKAEEAARQRQDDLMVITHQLQAPLSSMLGIISYLRKRAPLTASAEDRLGMLDALVTDAIALCYGTFTTFAMEGGRKLFFGVRDIDASEELRKLAGMMQRTNAREDLDFAFVRNPEFPTVRMDRNVFTSVFYSLLHNAMKYGDPGSRVTLTCGFEQGRPSIRVKSVGAPIWPSEAEKIFERFGRGSATEAGRYHSGAGLGLWVARSLMRAVGGDLTVELSAADPRLSAFVVHLPEGEPGGSKDHDEKNPLAG